MDRVQQTLKVMSMEPVKAVEPVDQDNFACNVFTDREIASRVPKATYRAYKAAVKSAKSLEVNHADSIATAMKDWAVEHGATHFTHWFQPIHISTAEKHEAFLTPRGDDFHVIRVRFPLPFARFRTFSSLQSFREDSLLKGRRNAVLPLGSSDAPERHLDVLGE